MSERTITKTVRGMKTSDGAGVTLHRLIGQPALPRLDPFLMLDFFGSDNPGEYIAGFPPHPHRGFQTVTYMLAGKMRHKDSVGNEGLIDAGGIQWMNAGKGIIHEEMPEQESGLMQGFQLWVNLPAADKLSEPGYQDIPADDVPVFDDGAGLTVKVLAGNYQGIQGPVTTAAVSPRFLDMSLQSGKSVTLPITDGHSGFIYCYEGEISVSDTTLDAGTLGVISDTGVLTIAASTAARCIVVTGEPIREPVVQYGPFVMNTEAEIHQALQDYQSGRFAAK